MGSAIASGRRMDSLRVAQKAFASSVAAFIARPQRRCNFERLAAAAVALHDAGLADLEHRYGQAGGSFGGRMLPNVASWPLWSQAGKRFATAARASKRRRSRQTPSET
jgi:hypothetical protein